MLPRLLLRAPGSAGTSEKHREHLRSHPKHGGPEHLSVSSSHCWLGPALGTCQLSLWGQLWGLTGRWGHDTGRPEPCAQAERLRQEPSLSSVGSSGSGQRAAGVTTRLQPFEACLKKHAVEPDKWPPIPKGNLHQMQWWHEGWGASSTDSAPASGQPFSRRVPQTLTHIEQQQDRGKQSVMVALVWFSNPRAENFCSLGWISGNTPSS